MTARGSNLQLEPRAKTRLVRHALLGVALIVGGLLLVLPRPYHERTFRIDAGGCHLDTTVIEPVGAASSGGTSTSGASSGTTSRGTVVLLHGLAANRKIMSYLAEGFALQGLRVFVPD